jgi:hypothetical protein
MSGFVLPGGEDRTCVIGMTGTGKTVAAGFLLQRQRWNERPWVLIDFKNEILFDQIGSPPIQNLKLGAMPGKRGLYRMRVRPDQDDELEEWLWKIWHRENVGLFCDEFSLVPKGSAFKGILRQGRSKRIPVIACTQRPAGCDREIFTESNYLMCFRLKDERDYKTVEGMTGADRISVPLPPYHSYYYNAKENSLLTLPPVPPPDVVAKSFRDVVPYEKGLLASLFK